MSLKGFIAGAVAGVMVIASLSVSAMASGNVASFDGQGYATVDEAANAAMASAKQDKSIVMVGNGSYTLAYEKDGFQLSTDVSYVDGDRAYAFTDDNGKNFIAPYPVAYVEQKPVSDRCVEVAYAFNAFETEADKNIVNDFINNGLSVPSTFTTAQAARLMELMTTMYPYMAWNGDFVVSFDRDVKADSLSLSGQYDDWDELWLTFDVENDMAAGETRRLLASYPANPPITINYLELCTKVITFNCGTRSYSLDNSGTTINVALRLFENEHRMDESGVALSIGNYQYTYGDKDGKEYVDTTEHDIDIKDNQDREITSEDAKEKVEDVSNNEASSFFQTNIEENTNNNGVSQAIVDVATTAAEKAEAARVGKAKRFMNVAVKAALLAADDPYHTVRGMTFDVKPKIKTTIYVDDVEKELEATIPNEAIVAPISFRLPVDKSVLAASATVFHRATPTSEEDEVGIFPILVDANGNKYIELSASAFSEYRYVLNPSTWATATDAGYYDRDGVKEGLMRYLFDVQAEEPFVEYGVKFLTTPGDFTAATHDVVSGPVSVYRASFWGDLVNIYEPASTTIYGKAYIKYNDGTYEWSDTIALTPNFVKLFTED